MNIFIHTDDPKKAFALAKDILNEEDLKAMLVAYRDFDSEKYAVIWPENSDVAFRVKK
jgi:hypothetical protein